MNKHEALLKISDSIYAVLVEFASDGVEADEVAAMEDGLRDIVDAIVADLGITVTDVKDDEIIATMNPVINK